MTFRRPKSVSRVLTALITLLLHAWSVAPVAASVIYCIGEDGHSGFELVRAGDTGCAACCHDDEAASGHQLASPVSECRDILLTSPTGLSGRGSPLPPRSCALSFALPRAFVRLLPPSQVAKRSTSPPGSAAIRLRQHTVLLI